MWQSEAAVLSVKIHTKHQVCSPGRAHIMQRERKRVRQTSFEDRSYNCYLLYSMSAWQEKSF